MMAQVKPPRAAFINFPLGRQCGRPEDGAMQKRILQEALTILVTATSPGEIVELPFEWNEPFDWPGFMEDLKEMLEAEGRPIQAWKPGG
jgi:D-proline reductase (dithiol) PrdB